MKNIEIIKKSEGDKFYNRNLKFYQNLKNDTKLIELLKLNKIKAKNVLEIGCADGSKLNIIRKFLNSNSAYGVDLSNKAIITGKKKFSSIKLLKLCSLEIDKINKNFDLIICGFFLYNLDREEIFLQFDKIYKKLNKGGFLIIEDFDPCFKHSNRSIHNKKLISYKMSYDRFLEETGLFKILYKKKYDYPLIKKRDKKKFKSNEISITLYKKIDFKDTFPENI